MSSSSSVVVIVIVVIVIVAANKHNYRDSHFCPQVILAVSFSNTMTHNSGGSSSAGSALPQSTVLDRLNGDIDSRVQYIKNQDGFAANLEVTNEQAAALLTTFSHVKNIDFDTVTKVS